jgi:hypothetical protein
MICKLCHSEAELQNSHIISEFQYKPLYDTKHRFQVISVNPEQKERVEQKGFREKLLCLPCETKLSRWESYAKKVIFEDETHLIGRTGNFVRLGGISYREFKLYLLSLLWRMGISGLEIFSQVYLGPYEEKLRVHLIEENPGLPSEYPCFITGVLLGGRFEPGWISPPERIKVNGTFCYRMIISGVLYSFFVTERALAFDAGQVAINEEGNFLMTIEHAENIKFLREYLMQQSKAIHEREAAKK